MARHRLHDSARDLSPLVAHVPRGERFRDVMRLAVGTEFSVIRLAQGWSVEQVAERCGVTPAWVEFCELGRPGLPFDFTVDLCEVLGMPLSTVLARAEQRVLDS